MRTHARTTFALHEEIGPVLVTKWFNYTASSVALHTSRVNIAGYERGAIAGRGSPMIVSITATSFGYRSRIVTRSHNPSTMCQRFLRNVRFDESLARKRTQHNTHTLNNNRTLQSSNSFDSVTDHRKSCNTRNTWIIMPGKCTIFVFRNRHQKYADRHRVKTQ